MPDGAVRPEFEHPSLPPLPASLAVERRLPWWRRLAGSVTARRLLALAVLAGAWQLYAARLDNPLMLPSLGGAVAAMGEALAEGVLQQRLLASLEVLAMGYGLGLLAAAVLVAFAASFRFGRDLLATLTAMLNPLPAIALLPLALIWFGLGQGSLVFVIVHSVLWAVALNAHAGFEGVAESQRMAGRNIGLRGLRFAALILLPAAFPAILTGMRIGWAFAWRTLIAAELVFGASSRSGGLGWFIFEARMDMDTSRVFAGLLTIILIGLFCESVIFRSIETMTIRRWGMQRG